MEYTNFIKFMDESNIEDLPEPYKTIANQIGIDASLMLAETYGGITVYFPKAERALQTIRNKRIVKEFNGGNITELAKKYNLTESWIREILKEQRINENQMPLSARAARD
jgi:Mor family transcriptional regulator